MRVTSEKRKLFHEVVWQYYRRNGRSMPWRDDPSPYNVLVSELMLQQTQVARVIEKFAQFTARFPDIPTLAKAPLADVLDAWSGLGYNRRAKYLHEAAKAILGNHFGKVPADLDALITLPGIGTNTAGAILAYAFNQPVAFVETNIRTVFFHHFFPDRTDVSDREILELVKLTLPAPQGKTAGLSRNWYWALMDYGTELKASQGGRLDQSRHYKKQSAFEGSLRQMRGMIVSALRSGTVRVEALGNKFADARFSSALEGLIKDGLVEQEQGYIGLTGSGSGSHNG